MAGETAGKPGKGPGAPLVPQPGLRRRARVKRAARVSGSVCVCLPSTSRKLVPALGSLGSRQKHKLPDLPYDYGALEPHINAQIMELHHSKHHAAYVNNLNVTEEKYLDALQKGRCGLPARGSWRPGVFPLGDAPPFGRSLHVFLTSTRKISICGNLIQACICLLVFRIQLRHVELLFFFFQRAQLTKPLTCGLFVFCVWGCVWEYYALIFLYKNDYTFQPVSLGSGLQRK